MIKQKMVIALSLALLIAAISLPAPGDEKEAQFTADTDNLYRQLELFSMVLQLAKDKYIEEVSNEDLIYGALEGMLGALDPYSGFMKPELYGEMQVNTKGQFGGLGIEITMRNGILTVITPIEDTPASKAGVHPGDRIVKIEGETTEGIILMEAVKKLRGAPGTEVEITVMRSGEKELLDISITRAIIKIESVKEVRMLTEDIGYIRLVQFQQKTGGELLAGLEELKEEGMEGLILDLRYNPGGLLTTAIETAEIFLPEEKVVVKTIGRDDVVDLEVKTTDNGEFDNLPMVVLINEGSASGSEIVAGALRDNDRAILVGNTTFGKASVQTVIPMPDNSGVRLTTGHYYTASNRIIHEKGIEPDIVVELTPEEKYDLITRKYRGLEDLAGADMKNATPEEKILRKALEKIFDEEHSVEEQQVLESVVERLFGNKTEESTEGIEQDAAAQDDDEDDGEGAQAKESSDSDEQKEVLDPQLRVGLDTMKAILLERAFSQHLE